MYCPSCFEIYNKKVKAYAFTPDLSTPDDTYPFYTVCFCCYIAELKLLKLEPNLIVEWFKLQ